MAQPEIITWAAIAEEAGLTRPIIIPDDLSPYDLIAIVNSLAARALATARDEGRAEQLEVDAKKADAIAQGRERQKAEYRAANLTREARDFETMAMEASYVAAAIRKGEP